MSDLISRQAAIDATSEIVFVEYEDDDQRKEESIILQTKAAIRERIKALPSVQPKHGKWLPDNRCGGGYWVCSSCKYPTEAFAADVLYKYCPFCGADMRGGKE